MEVFYMRKSVNAISEGFSKDEVKIEKDLNGLLYQVFVWKNQWIMVSGHRNKGDAETVVGLILNGGSSKDVRDLLDSKMSDGRSTLKLKYYENW
jgi:hypothetical protein